MPLSRHPVCVCVVANAYLCDDKVVQRNREMGCMAQPTRPPESTSVLASWLDYLAAPAEGGGGSPSEGWYVLAAVLTDDTVVRIDDEVRWFPSTCTYRSESANLDLPIAARNSDGVFTIDSGQYRIMVASEYARVKRVEAARAEAEAAVAVSSPRGSRASLSAPVEQGLANLNVSGAVIGCGAHARMVTIISVGPLHVGAAIRRAASIVQKAQKANNVVVTVVLGVASDLEAEEALHISGQRVLLAGAHEMRHLRRGRDAAGPMRLYLREAVLLECIAGTGNGLGADGEGGVWVLPADSVPLVDPPQALAASGMQSRRDAVARKDALNGQWREWYRAYSHTQADPLTVRNAELLAAYTSFPVPTGPMPRIGLPLNSTACIGIRPAPPFGVVDHTIRWHLGATRGEKKRAWPEPAARWSSTGGGPASVYWTVTTWCGSTRAALRATESLPALAPNTDEDELQWEVDRTVESLATYEVGGQTPFRDPETFGTLKGVLGPVVHAGRDNAQPMRAVWWTLAARPGGVLMLLPEAYVRMAIESYPAQTPTAHGSAFLCVQGFLVLADADALPLTFGDRVEPGEALEEARALGARLWIPNGATAAEAHHALADVDAAATIAGPLPSFRTRRDSDAARVTTELVPGRRIKGTPGRTIYYTSTSSEDTLSGLRVRFLRREDSRGTWLTLDVDTHADGAQLSYESFA